MRIKKILIPLSLTAVILLAFILRFNKVAKDPPSLNWDEVSIGYNAYSILKTGKDEWGVKLPVHFKSYGEYKLPVQIYASIPGIAIFGLNEFGLRITPVIYGTLTVLLLFFLALEISKNFSIGLLSSFFLAISPWHVQLTRASFESGFSVFWVVMGVLFFVKGFANKRYWLWSLVPFIVSIYTYNAARVFVPIFLVVLFILFRKAILKHTKTVTLGLILFVVAMVPLISFYVSGEATARLQLVSISDDPGFVQRINVARGKSNLPSPLPKLIHNKFTHYVYVFAGNYLSHFTPSFLFINGAGHKQHHVQGIGEFYVIQAPFILIGLYFLFKKKNIPSQQYIGNVGKWRWLLLSWTLITFIPVSVTVDSIPNALRTILVVIPYEIFCALGFVKTLNLLRNDKRVWGGVIVASLIILGAQFNSYLNNYYDIYPVKYSRDWQYGNKEAVNFIKDNYGKYDLIVYTRAYGEPHMFTLFYLNWEPAKFQNDSNLDRFETFDWVRVLKFDKFYFPDLGDNGTRYLDVIKANPGKKILFIGKKEDFPDNLPRLLTINFLNGNSAFDIVEQK